MPVSTDLKALVSRLDAAIDGRDSWGQLELGALRRDLDKIAADAISDETRAAAVAPLLAELGDGLERGIEGLQRLERRARQAAAR